MKIFITAVCLMIASLFVRNVFAESSLKIKDPSPQYLYDHARDLIKNRELLEAQEIFQKILDNHPDFDAAPAVEKDMENLNLEIIFSDIHTSETIIYKVHPRDTLARLAQKFHTTVDLIKKRNDLASDVIRSGQKISIYTSPFNIVIDKSNNILILRNNDKIVKVYPVSTGKENTTTPTGEFTIKDRLIDPVWFHHGIVVPPGTVKNFLGTRWLGFNIPKYGIHGTVEPELIGKSVSGGCVRMHNTDVEELFTLIPEGTKVVIIDLRSTKQNDKSPCIIGKRSWRFIIGEEKVNKE